MGIDNRNRPHEAAPPPDEEQARAAVLAAAMAFRFEPRSAYRLLLRGLPALDPSGSGKVLDRAVASSLEQGLERAWSSGWQPADVVRAVRRILGPPHAKAIARSVADSAAQRPEAAGDDRWADAIAALRAHPHPGRFSGSPSQLALAVEAISVLLHLPRLPPLPSGGHGRTRPRGDRAGAMLERVRALLAKAESTSFPEEAEALTTKAQELMARYAIDEAMLESAPETESAGVVGWRIGVDDPYASAKSLLLDRIADANRCRSVWTKQFGFSTVFGSRTDLEMVELLFTSLLVQGTDAMLRAGRSVDFAGRSRTRSFRQSFLVAYASRIGERLWEATERVVAEGAERHGAVLLPVLAGRAEAVDGALRAAYPRMVERGVAISNYSGWAAGTAAADLASLSVGGVLPGE